MAVTELTEALIVGAYREFCALQKDGCLCDLIIIFRPFSKSLLYEDSCPVHHEQWRREHLGLM